MPDANTFAPIDITRMSAEAYQPIEAATPASFTDRLSDVARSMYAVLVDSDKERADDRPVDTAQLAIRLVVQLCHDFGGSTFYLHKAPIAQRKRTSRDEAIAREFNGKNTVELMRRYGLTDMRIRQIVKQQRQQQDAARLSPQQIEARNGAIAAQFTGKNHKALADKSGLSVRQIERIVEGSKPTNDQAPTINRLWP